MRNSVLPAMPINKQLENTMCNGVTKREYFAGLAMQGILSGFLSEEDHRWSIEDVAREAVDNADELLKQLAQ